MLKNLSKTNLLTSQPETNNVTIINYYDYWNLGSDKISYSVILYLELLTEHGML
jgi:hypothetical protein